MLRRDKREIIDHAQVNLTRLFHDQQQFKLDVLNISRGGLCFSSNEDFDVDEQVSLVVHQDDREIHRATGRICYCAKNTAMEDYYGISFLDNYLSVTDFSDKKKR